MSTPNRLTFSPGSVQPWHPFHVTEYTWDELQAVLGPFFKRVQLYSLCINHRIFQVRYLRATLDQVLPFPLAHIERYIYWHLPPWNRLHPGQRHITITPGYVPGCWGFVAVCAEPVLIPHCGVLS